MARSKDVIATIKIELEAGNASISELGKMLSIHGVPIVEIKRQYDEKTASQSGHVVPIVVEVYQDKSWNLEIRRPTTSSLIRGTLGNSGRRTLTQDELRAIAEQKLPDLNAHEIDAALRTIAGTARSMGVSVEAT